MPILERETDCWPPELLEAPPGDGLRRWRAVYSRARQEKAIARFLASHHVPFYLPLVPRVTRQRGCALESYVPLFSGYLFLFGTSEERVLGLKSNRISQVLEVADQAGLWRDLMQVRRALESGESILPESELQPGQQVRVARGPLYGLEGRVLYRSGTCRLVLAVNFLSQGVSVEVEDFVLEAVD